MRPKTLFLIDGATGTGKSDLVTYIHKKYQTSGTACIVTKLTTRKKRIEENKFGIKLDLEFINEDDFESVIKEAICFVYEYGGNRYAIRKKELDRAIMEYESVFLIVRDYAVINRLKQVYDHVRVMPIQIYSDRDLIIKRLSEDGYNQEAIDFRLARQDHVWQDYLRHPGIYEEIIINNSSKNDFQRLIDILITKYSYLPPDILQVSARDSFPLTRPLIGFKPQMIERLDRYPYHKNIFLMMKFRDSNKLVYEFISEQIEARGFNCVRADHGNWNITGNVYNPIAVLYCCKYGIALFDESEERNTFSPNVAYELGMMHLQRKSCLILRHNSLPPMPFDLIKDLHQPYTKDLELRQIVVNWLNTINE